MQFSDNEFFNCAHGRIYKYRKKHNDFLLLTPWEEGEDRIVHSYEQLDHPIKMNKNVANQIINDIWRNTEFHWSFGGKQFKTRETFWDKDVDGDFSYKYEIEQIAKNSPFHIWHHTTNWTDSNGVEQTLENDMCYKLGMYRGKLVWVQFISQYLPQVVITKFESIDKEPTFDRLTWTNIKSIQSIYNITDGCYI